MRDYLGDLGFWEIETPFLTRSTPEGARDFIVPVAAGARQLLCAAAVAAVVQAASDGRRLRQIHADRPLFPRRRPAADRQAEFTQLDVEMCFIDRENIIAIMEGLLRLIWKEILGIEIPNPIPHMEYDEAMTRYGSDRPDLRFGMQLHDITDLAHTTDFGVFKNAADGESHLRARRREADPQGNRRAGRVVQGIRRQGTGRHESTANGALDTGVAKFLQPIAAKLIERTGAKEGDLLCFAADKPKIVHKVLGELAPEDGPRSSDCTPSTEFAWVWVVNFPLFEYDEEEKRFTSTHHPFTAPLDEDLRSSTAATGASSSRSRAKPTTSSSTAAKSAADRSVSIAWTCSRKSSRCSASTTPPESEVRLPARRPAIRRPAARRHRPGSGPAGHDPRGITNIRDVIAFPKTQSGADLMCGAPAPIDEKQLREANIRIATPPPKQTPAVK